MNSKVGYITLACGSDKYLRMAVTLALSIKLNDPTRPICLIHDENIRLDPGVEKIFDYLVLMPSEPDYVGCMNKIRLFDYSPFEKTIYIDSDSVMVKNDMEQHWKKFDGNYFNLAGTKKNSGVWYQLDLAEVCRKADVPYIVTMNSGVFYFERNARAKAFFEQVKELFVTKRDLVGRIHQGRLAQYADEPFIGLAMGLNGIMPLDDSSSGPAIMKSTVWSRGCEFDPFSHVSKVQKASGYIVPKLWARSWSSHSPSIVHFVKLKPTDLYFKMANRLRDHFGFPPYHA
jgi:hypothetical protein